jgi:trk system potassium uptake protein
MNYRLLAKVLGLLVLLNAAALLLCELYAVATERTQPGQTHDFALLESFAVAALAGGVLLLLGRGSGREILRKEAIAVVGLGWLLSTMVGALPYILCETPLPPAAAFFESASGYTTTGSSAIPDLTVYAGSILLWRGATQWLGGLGILVLFVALLSTFGVGSKALFRHESSAQIGYGFDAKIRQTALRFIQIYVALTALCIAGLMVLGMSFFDATVHSFAAVSTGGFSTRNESLMYYGSAAMDAWLCLFMTLGGTNFVLIAWVLRGKLSRFWADDEFRTYLTILAGATAVIVADLMIRQGQPFAKSLQVSSFNVISVMTTTGFANADFDQWPILSKALLVLLMFVGGCSGSTSGGIKVSRVLIFFKAAGQQITNAYRPSRVVPLRLNGEIVEESQKAAAIFFVALTAFIVGISTVVITVLEPDINHVSSFTAVTATLFNIGPGLDAVGPMRNFAFLNPASHLVLAFLMILGRLEFFAVLVLFMPSLWKRY